MIQTGLKGRNSLLEEKPMVIRGGPFHIWGLGATGLLEKSFLLHEFKMKKVVTNDTKKMFVVFRGKKTVCPIVSPYV